MQESVATPNWLQLALGLVASFLAGGAGYKYLLTWLNRKKPGAEVHLTEATTTEIKVRAASNAGDAIMRFISRLDEAQITIDRLRAERNAWEQQYGEEYSKRVELQATNQRLTSENESYEMQIKTMQATLKIKGKNYDNTQDIPLVPPK